MKFIYYLLTLILFFNFLPFSVNSEPLDYNNLTHLITCSDDYIKYGFEDMGKYYTNEFITTAYLPFVVNKTIDFKTNEVGFSFLNMSNDFDKRLISVTYELYENENYHLIIFTGNFKAKNKPLFVDILPTIKNIPITKYAWWNTSYNYFRTITINEDSISSGISINNYPMLVVINSTIGQYCDEGKSIRFVDITNTTEYFYEIEKWNTSGNSFVWVNVTNIYDGFQMNMYYNNSNAEDNQNPTNVWDSDYIMVQHMDGDDYDTILDSTSNNNDVVSESATSPSYQYESNDIIGYAVDFKQNSYLKFADEVYGGYPSTWEVYTEPDDDTEYERILCSGGGEATSRGILFMTRVTQDYGLFCRDADSGGNLNYLSDASFGLNNLTWTHLAITWGGVGIDGRMYQNGVWEGKTPTDVNSGVARTLTIASRSDLDQYYYDGRVDEIRISKVIRNNSYLFANYNTTRKYLSFYTWGNVVSVETPSLPQISNLSITNNSIIYPLEHDNISCYIYHSNGSLITYNMWLSTGIDTVTDSCYNSTIYLNLTHWLLTNRNYTLWINLTVGIITNNSYFVFTTHNNALNVSGLGGDSIEWDVTQFGIMLQLFLFVVFVWISFKIPNAEGTKSFHRVPFSGGLFMFFAGVDFLSISFVLRTYLIGWINEFLVIVGIVLLIYGILQAFYYADG